MSVEIKIPKKLIEVALPLDDINIESSREKSIRHGHPSTLHLWWARRPLAAARAVIFAQMVNDPGYERSLGRGVNKEAATKERQRLFNIIRRLVKWENTTNDEVLEEAKVEILKSWRETCELNKNHPDAKTLFNPEILPGLHDPFAGGGTIPLEAQRLGIEAFASDLNPVASFINKVMIELPSLVKITKPIGPLQVSDQTLSQLDFSEAKCLSEDIGRYGLEILKIAKNKLNQFYPNLTVTKALASKYPPLKELVGENLTLLGLFWCRSVRSPNPAFAKCFTPLASTFVLSSKEGNEVWLKYETKDNDIRFNISYGRVLEKYKNGTKSARGANFVCAYSGVPISAAYIKEQGKLGMIRNMPLAGAFIHEGTRYFISAEDIQNFFDLSKVPASETSNVPIPNDARNFWILNYGVNTFGDLFNHRQSFTINTFIESLAEIQNQVESDYKKAYQSTASDIDAKNYAKAISAFLACAISRGVDYWSMNALWENNGGFVAHVFSKQSLPMVWDYFEANPLGDVTGSWSKTCLDWVVRVAANLKPRARGHALQASAQDQSVSLNKVISTDPPYYDNISYADLSDYFYIWLRKSQAKNFPELFGTISTPKSEELVASPYRHKDKNGAEKFFMTGMESAFKNLIEKCNALFPITIYYAFKQSEKTSADTHSVGWDSFLSALIDSGWEITGTWPLRTERTNRPTSIGTNALASSIVLVCRKRTNKNTISRREFMRELNSVLPEAIETMTYGAGSNCVAPVDLSQAVIGPGMAIYSKYSAVIEADGKPMSVKTALQLINRFLAEDDFDLDTQFCLNWFETNGWSEGLFGQADVLARAKGTSVEGLRDGGVAKSSAGKFSLIKWQDLSEEWSPETDNRTSHWEMLHYLIRAYNKNGESSAGVILARIHSKSETIRALAYRLYTVCERKKYAEDAANYNNLILAWEAIEMAAQSVGVKDTQTSLFESELDVKETNKKTKRKK